MSPPKKARPRRPPRGLAPRGIRVTMIRDEAGNVIDPRPHLQSESVLFRRYIDNPIQEKTHFRSSSPYSKYVKLDTGSNLCLVSAFTIAKLLHWKSVDIHYVLDQLAEEQKKVQDVERATLLRIKQEIEKEHVPRPFHLVDITSNAIHGTTLALGLDRCIVCLRRPGKDPEEVALVSLVTYRGSSSVTPVLGMPFLGAVSWRLEHLQEPRGWSELSG